MHRLISLLTLTAALGTSPALAAPIKPTDPNVRYVGRFDFRDATGPKCAWPASTVEIAFRGTSLRATVREEGKDQYQVVVDGSPTQILKLSQGEQAVDVAAGLPAGSHTVQLVKRTEAFVGTTQFVGFDVDGTLSRPKRPRHILEVIGDSISCGFGDEGKTKNDPFTNDTENAYLTYGAVAARSINADFLDIAWSGRKMWPDNSIPEIYDLALPADKSSIWDLKQETPGAIVINLATNDFGRTNPDEKGWTEAYAAFIGRLRLRAPGAMIYCAMGPMMTDNWPPKNRALSTLQKYLDEVVAMRRAAGDLKVTTIEFETQNEQRDGIGAAYHPNVTTQRNMAERLVTAIHKDLGW